MEEREYSRCSDLYSSLPPNAADKDPFIISSSS